VVALFEFKPVSEDTAAERHLFDVRIRYKEPGESESQLLELPVATGNAERGTSSDFGFVSAVALFGDYLREGGDGERAAVPEMISLAEDNLGADREGYREDFVALLYKLRSMG
jgi:Ca-activated chloride channel family protein